MPRASGRFVLRIEPGLHERLRRLATRNESSLNHLCADLIQKGLSAGIAGARPADIASEVVPGIVIERTARRLQNQLEGLVLFGSAARGEMWEHSDVDLLVVLRQGASITRQLYSAWDTEIASVGLRLSHRISPHFVALPRDARRAGGLWFEVALDGVILWDPKLRVARLLSSLRREIAAGAVERRFAHGQPYWVRLPKTA